MGRLVVAVSLGSNLGARDAHLQFGRERLAEGLSALRFSSIHETEAEGVSKGQPPFLNQAAVGETSRAPEEILAWLLAIERARGRERPFRGASRTLDLDLILAGDRIAAGPGLVLPHPRFRGRRFVLEPLAEIAPDMVDPVSGRTIRELFDRLGTNAPSGF